MQPDRITIRTAGVYALSGAARWDPDAGTVVVLKAAQTSGSPLEIDDASSPQVHLSATWVAP